MITHGYTKIPRLTDKSLTGRAIAVLEYICENVRINAPRETELGTEGIGEMFTTRSRLVKRFRTTAQKIRSDLKMLAEAGYIEIETSTRCTRIRVVWQDFALLNGYDIMLNNQANNQANNQPTTFVSSDISNGCKDLKNKITNRITNRITNINNKDIYNDNIHTHSSNYLVETKSAPARESALAPAYTPASHSTPTNAAELVKWIDNDEKVSVLHALPEKMLKPLTIAQAESILKRYAMEDVLRLLDRVVEKRLFVGYSSVEGVFQAVAECDFELRRKETEPKAKPDDDLWSIKRVNEFLNTHGSALYNQNYYFDEVKREGQKSLYRLKEAFANMRFT